MSLKYFLPFILILIGNTVFANNCHPVINPKHDNYIIGYGSLMNNASRSETNPDAKKLLPVKVFGFVRDWNAASEEYKIIFLGATQCKNNDKNCFLNGLAYTTGNIQATDSRENGYCRYNVPINNISFYKKSDSLDTQADYWIYVIKPEDISHPNNQHPLIQSYVDLFIGGCLEQAANIQHKSVKDLIFPQDYNFVFDCIKGTRGWTTTYWLNDRIYPQRPWAMNPYALKIDQVLNYSYKHKMIIGKYAYTDIPLEK